MALVFTMGDRAVRERVPACFCTEDTTPHRYRRAACSHFIADCYAIVSAHYIPQNRSASTTDELPTR